MSTTLLNEPRRAGSCVLFEEALGYSREVLPLDTTNSPTIVDGTVLGRDSDTGLHVPVNLSATDGSQNAVAVAIELYVNDTVVALVRHAAVKVGHVVYPSAATTAQKDSINAALASVGILVR